MTTPTSDALGHAAEISAGKRFEFGRNWSHFLERLNDERVRRAEDSLRTLLGVSSLTGRRFLDIGSGSGLFSLAARRLGATVHSFDYDPRSVACTTELRRRFFPSDDRWTIEQGSALDAAYLKQLGTFDVVYSWGVLHHTGAMWQALENAAPLVKPGGLLAIALYNDQGKASRRWTSVQRLYNRLPSGLRFLVLGPSFVYLWARPIIKDFILLRPFRTWREYSQHRGMSAWIDLVDWVGGYPREVAKPEEVFDFFRQRGFELRYLHTVGGNMGNNEWTFIRQAAQ